ncbi:hypothetical protein [Natronorubrum sulfidifaciens]|uniref:hypothetical protein n=1 Tax=Natronorubrum sulfidifaciens TaxID=388259 RepID=UPI000AF7D00B|nr:hypothetical protein [Natronorubrum sulfidifaciens]
MKSELHRSDIEQAREGVKEFLERRCFSTETEREIKAALETDPLKALETALQARNN